MCTINLQFNKTNQNSWIAQQDFFTKVAHYLLCTGFDPNNLQSISTSNKTSRTPTQENSKRQFVLSQPTYSTPTTFIHIAHFISCPPNQVCFTASTCSGKWCDHRKSPGAFLDIFQVHNFTTQGPILSDVFSVISLVCCLSLTINVAINYHVIQQLPADVAVPCRMGHSLSLAVSTISPSCRISLLFSNKTTSESAAQSCFISFRLKVSIPLSTKHCSFLKELSIHETTSCKDVISCRQKCFPHLQKCLVIQTLESNCQLPVYK